MSLDQTSPSESQHQVQQGAVLVQDQEHIQEREEHFVTQVTELAQKEWETFHLQYPAIDAETFRQAQRFCVQQWVVQRATLLSNLSAFERAQEHVEWEVAERAKKYNILTK